MTAKVYDPEQISIALGNIILGGYADGEFIRIEPETAAFADVVGTDGEVSRSKSADRRASVTFSLMQTSSSNLLLSALVNADLAAPNGAGITDLMIRDQNGSTLYRAAEAWIMEEPDVMYDRTATSRQWVIRAAKLIRVDAGN